jgi:hypothetical protein
MKAGGLRLMALWRAIGAALIAFVIYQSLNLEPLEVTVVPGNVGGHLLAYGTLMWWHSQLADRPGMRGLLAAGFVLMGVLLEIAQYFTGYRTLDPADAFANAAGVALGWLLAPPRGPAILRRFEQALGRRGYLR